ncbi:MAG: hypothetical protein F6K11_12075 [Leptolyngbya sp. SIO3F4]|nr:hypothetical protein [Leptolyngbya sp. SIO3F4]
MATTPAATNSSGAIRIEAEMMSLSGQYVTGSKFDVSVIETKEAATSGTASITFSGTAGRYMVFVHYLDESDGQSTVAFNVEGQTIDSWVFNDDDNNYKTRAVSADLTLNPGDLIEISATGDSGEHARIDYIDLIPVDNLFETYGEGTNAFSTSMGIFQGADTLIFEHQDNMLLDEGTLAFSFETNAIGSSQYLFSKDSSWYDDGGHLSVQINSSGQLAARVQSTTTSYEVRSNRLNANQVYDAAVTFGSRGLELWVNGQLVDDTEYTGGLGSSSGGSGNREPIVIGASQTRSGDLVADNLEDYFTGTLKNIRLIDQQLGTAAISQLPVSIPSDANVIFETLISSQGSSGVNTTTPESPTEINNQTQPWQEGLVAYWAFDELSGNTVTDSVGGLSGNLVNMETTDRIQGMVGKALNFDGVNERGVVNDSGSLTLGDNNADFSVSFWLKLEEDATGTWRTVLHKGATGQDRTFGTWLQPNDNLLHYRISTTANWNEGGNSQTPLILNKWTHVAYVKEGNQLSLYLDGQLDSNVTLQGEVIGNDGPLRLGSNRLDASLDELRLYDRALSTNDLQSLALVSADVLEGGQGQDTLYGNEGDDQLYGESRHSVDPIANTSTAGVFRGGETLIIDHQDTMLLDEGTLAFSFKADDISSSQHLFSKDSSGYDSGGHLGVELKSDGRLEVRLQSVASSYYVRSNVLNARQTYDVAITFGSLGLELWIDGQRVSTNSYTGGLGNTSGGSGNYESIVLGASQATSGDLVANNLTNYFSGTLQNVRLLDQQLSSEAISQLPVTTVGANTIFEAFTSDQGNNDVLVGGQGHDTVMGNLGDDILYGDDATVLVSGVQHNGSLYLLTQDTDWLSAQAQAQLWGGNLVTVNDATEQAWLVDTFGTSEELWIGFTDETVEGEWQWISGETSTYSFWMSGRPDNYGGIQHYGYLNADSSGRWNDESATEQRRGIIEIKLPENAAGNDVLIGNVGNDTLYGELGDDVLNGTSAQAAGAYEVDILIGGHGVDRFILGDVNQAYYLADDRLDYALIKDFTVGIDILQLHGSIGDYHHTSEGSDTLIYYGVNQELVAWLQNTNDFNLNSNSVNFV